MDTANSFVMSSYQFVNSLASCYPQSSLNQTANTNNNNNNVANANPNAPADYFPPSAYTPNLYPGASQNHYAGGQAYGGLGSQPGQNDMVDYTQLQPQKFLLNQQQQNAQHQQPQQPSSAAPVNSQSCKFANDSISSAGTGNSTSLSSPQDLSTARDISPKLSPNSVVENVTRNLSKVASGVNSSNNSANHNSNTGPLRSPEPDDSDASSESGGEGGGGSQSNSGKKGPPHIYPWMKRVHIGQSNYKSLPSLNKIVILRHIKA